MTKTNAICSEAALTAVTVLTLALVGCGAELTGYDDGQTRDGADVVAADDPTSPAGDNDATPVDGVDTAGAVEKGIFPCNDPDLCCTADQQRSINADERQAKLFMDIIAVDRAALLASAPGSVAKQRLQTAFGTTADNDLAFVFDTYQLIDQNLSNTNYSCVPDEGECSGGALAVNQSPDDNQVHLCPVYFTSDTTRRSQVLVHEASHQGRNTPDGLGTDDIAAPSIFSAFSYERYVPVCASAQGCF